MNYEKQNILIYKKNSTSTSGTNYGKTINIKEVPQPNQKKNYNKTINMIPNSERKNNFLLIPRKWQGCQASLFTIELGVQESIIR